MDHDHLQAKSTVPEPADTAPDPVCGMTIGIGPETRHAEFQDKTFHFCSAKCQTKFTGDPWLYASARTVRSKKATPEDVEYTLKSTIRGSAQARDRALARWANEGGSGQCGRESDLASGRAEAEMPAIGDAQLGLLQIRVIALENLIIALLATASCRQLDIARDMARTIEPQIGAAPHPLTIRAAARMTDLIERSARFQNGARPQAKDVE